MSSNLTPEHEAFIQQEVERAIAPYRKIAPPSLLPMLRDVAERYWRTHPQALVIARTVLRPTPDASQPTGGSGLRRSPRTPPGKR